MYGDFMSSFAQNLQPWISSGVINQIQVGLGPAGNKTFNPFKALATFLSKTPEVLLHTSSVPISGVFSLFFFRKSLNRE